MKLEEIYKKLKSEIGDREFKIAEIRIFINGYAQDFRFHESMYSEKIDLILKEEQNVIEANKNGCIFNPWNYCDVIGMSKEDILHEEQDAFKQFINESVKRIRMKCDKINPETWERFIDHLLFLFR
jgi:glycyl-tRNA synthetase (class II)